MKNIRHILFTILAVIIGFYCALLIVLNIPFFRTHLTNWSTKLLSNELACKITVQDINVGLFNRIVLQNLCVYDQNQNKLLTADAITAKVDLIELIKGNVKFEQLLILNSRTNIYKNSQDGEYNFEYLKDVFKPSKEDTPKAVISFDDITIKNSEIYISNTYIAQKADSLFDKNHICISNLNTSISLCLNNNNASHVSLHYLNCKEQSGIEIKNAQLSLLKQKEGIYADRILVETPHSIISNVKPISIKFDDTQNNDFLSHLSCGALLIDAKIGSKDLAYFSKIWNNLNDKFEIQVDIKKEDDLIEVEKVSVQSKNIKVLSNALYSTIDKSYSVDFVNASISSDCLQEITNFSKNKNKVLLQKLGAISYSGKLRCNDSIRLVGSLHTSLGNIDEQIVWNTKKQVLTYKIDAPSFDLQNFVSFPLSTKGLSCNGQGSWDKELKSLRFDASLKALHFNNKSYRDINLESNWENNIINWKLHSTDKNIDGFIVGNSFFDGKSVKKITLNSKVNNFSVSYILDKNPNKISSIQGDFSAQFKSILPLELDSKISVAHLNITQDTTNYSIPKLDVEVTPKSMAITSDIGVLQISAPLNLKFLKEDAYFILSKIVPNFFNKAEIQSNRTWKLYGKLYDGNLLSNLLGLPIKIKGSSSIETIFHADNNKRSYASILLPELVWKNQILKNIEGYIEYNDKLFSSILKCEKQIGNHNIHFELNADNKNDRINTNLYWNDKKGDERKGAICLQHEISKQQIKTNILPTTFALSDTLWHIDRGSLLLKDGSINIDGLKLHHNNQMLYLKGKISDHDTLKTSLKNIDLKYVMNLVNFHAVDFSGPINGNINFSKRKGNLFLDAELNSPLFIFNTANMGKLDLLGSYDFTNKLISLDGKMNDKGKKTFVIGYVDLYNKTLLLDVESKNSNITFLNPYITGIIDHLEGNVSGDIRIFGPLKHIDFIGKEKVNGKFRLLPTNVYYSIQDGIVDISPGSFSFNNVVCKDERDGTAHVNASITHTHLKDLRYKVEANTKNLLLFSTCPEMNLPFKTTVFANSAIHLNGYKNNLHTTLDVEPTEGTTFSYSLDNDSKVEQLGFISFVSPEANKNKETDEENNKSTPNLYLDINLNVTPSTKFTIVTDSKSNDALTTEGYGIITANYYNKGNLQLFGNYTVDNGVYKMNLQNFIHKNFTIQKGSNINFTGVPQDGNIDLQAIYTLNSVPLEDLNLSNSQLSSTEVNCLLNLKGKLNEPTISFDIDLPKINDDEKNMVKQLISNEQDLNRQVLYLLSIGRFYNPNFEEQETSDNTTQSQMAMYSFLSNTFSNQINNMISSALGSSNWTIGTNLSTGAVGTKSMEFGGSLSGKLLHNRLIFNSKFGYREGTYYTNNFIGDFSAQYYLTPKRNISLKAYSVTNDRYFTKSSLTTQGIGIMMNKDFNKFKELFKRKK